MISKIRSVHTVREVFRLLVCGALLTGVVSAQVDPNQTAGAIPVTPKDNLSEAMNRLKQGDFFPADVDLIAKIRGVQAIPDLERQFELTQDQVLKASIASVLVRLGDKDPAWWNYLVQGVADAIASDAPPLQRFDSKGKMLPGLSPELIAWAKAHNLSDSELQTEMLRFRQSCISQQNRGSEGHSVAPASPVVLLLPDSGVCSPRIGTVP